MEAAQRSLRARAADAAVVEGQRRQPLVREISRKGRIEAGADGHRARDQRRGFRRTSRDEQAGRERVPVAARGNAQGLDHRANLAPSWSVSPKRVRAFAGTRRKSVETVLAV